MKRTVAVLARLGVVGIPVPAFVAVAGSGPAQATPRDCVVERDLFSASAVCQPDELEGAEYILPWNA
ncbi:hypothetical protein [Nocardia sp. SC052]|uniref:hypothetical protein n=1 Tax=Nocardia sichangensis TaxID=3385975 RepID=UPI00399F6F0A